MERGGPEGALIFFALQAVDGRLFETLDRDMNLLTSSTVEEMAKSLVAT